MADVCGVVQLRRLAKHYAGSDLHLFIQRNGVCYQLICQSIGQRCRGRQIDTAVYSR